MAVAAVGIGSIVRLSPPELPRVASIGLDGVAFVFGLVVTTAIGLAFGSIPALQAVRGDPGVGLQRASRRTTGGLRGTRSALVVTEVALALLLLVSSGLLLRSIERLFAVSSGFDADPRPAGSSRLASHPRRRSSSHTARTPETWPPRRRFKTTKRTRVMASARRSRCAGWASGRGDGAGSRGPRDDAPAWPEHSLC